MGSRVFLPNEAPEIWDRVEEEGQGSPVVRLLEHEEVVVPIRVLELAQATNTDCPY